MDYGHELQFGTFITPLAAQSDAVLELAQLTEVAGLDLVTVQDHPYQARFLDVWTLLTAIIARTSSLRVAPNVVNLPLRPPFVLAKTVASLDLIGNGRVELGLGAGGFTDAIVAAGGPRRTGGEALAALAEAIEILRATWDTSQRSVRHDGEFYSVVGAHTGPAPAHRVEIWLGAIKPKMLALTGRAADGWLPSMSYVPPDVLAERNAVIDEAARSAGRSPDAIRRLYNVNAAADAGSPGLRGSSADWAEQLAGLTIEHGMSTFLLAVDSADEIRRFAAEVVPRVRELVEVERGRAAAEPSTSAPVVTAVPAAPRDEPSGLHPTPDDGHRRSDRRVWDENARPRYQPPALGRDYTAPERATAQHLVDIHDHLRAELAQVQDLLGQVQAGTVDIGAARSLINTMTLRQNNWTLGAYCESYCRVVTTHHTLEDRSVFPHLRRSDVGLAPVLDRLESEHHVIAEVLDEVDQALVALVAGPDGLRRLQAAVDLLSDTLTSHLAYEESQLLEPLARYSFY